MHDDTSAFRRKEWRVNEFVPQIGSGCAFEWDLRAKVGDSKGILLPIQRILLLCKQNVEPSMHFGASEIRFWSSFGPPGAPWMHNDTLVFRRKCEVSVGFGHKAAVHVHSSGI